MVRSSAVVVGVVAALCAQLTDGYAQDTQPAVAKKTTTAPPAAAPPAAAPPTKKTKKSRKRSAADDRRLFELSKEGRAFAELLATGSPAPSTLAGANGVTGAAPLPSGLGSGWPSVHASKCCGADEGVGGGVGTAVGVGTGTGYSGYGPRDKAPSTGSVHLVVRGVGESPPATTAIRSRIVARMALVKRCAQSQGATVASKTTLEFAIQETGRVVDVKASGNNQVVVDCIVKSAGFWRFPEPEKNTAQTRFEVTFTSTP